MSLSNYPPGRVSEAEDAAMERAVDAASDPPIPPDVEAREWGGFDLP